MNDCQGEGAIGNLINGLRELAVLAHKGHAIRAAAEGLTHENRLEWCAADAIETLLGKILSLSQERDRLREALAPFANIPPVTLSEGDQRPLYAAHYWCVIGSPDKTHFTREDLARARAALNKEPPCQET